MITFATSLSALFRKAAQAAIEEDHFQRLEELFRIIREECSKKFNEDNAPTTNAFLLERFEKSYPYPAIPVMNAAAEKLHAEKDAEIARLRDLLQEPQLDASHQCRKCLFKYTPIGVNEDCPRCEHDGKGT
jgi:hypothetical protein